MEEKVKGQIEGTPHDPVEIPIEGVLDLHTFSPREISDLLTNYLELCRKKGFREVRIIHGKGSGQLRRTVQSILRKNSTVKGFCLAGEERGGWGATIVELLPQDTLVSPHNPRAIFKGDETRE